MVLTVGMIGSMRLILTGSGRASTPGREGLVRRTALVRRVDAQFSRRVRGIASGLGIHRNVVVGPPGVRRGAPGATFTIWAPGQAVPGMPSWYPLPFRREPRSAASMTRRDEGS